MRQLFIGLCLTLGFAAGAWLAILLVGVPAYLIATSSGWWSLLYIPHVLGVVYLIGLRAEESDRPGGGSA